MRWNASFAPIFVIFFLAAAKSATSQVSPASTRSSATLSAGIGLSYYNADYSNADNMLGLSVWVDYGPPYMPHIFSGLKIEAEGRDVNFNRPSSLSRFREYTFLGGPIYFYSWHRYPHFRPYGKALFGIGSMDFPPYGTYDHDSRTVFAPGGGADYSLKHNLLVRADYEYQIWPVLISKTRHPQGFTIGVLYTFGGDHRY